MSNENILTPEVETTALVLAAAGELTAQIFKRVAGNDISTGLNGETLTKEMVSTLATATMRQALIAR